MTTDEAGRAPYWIAAWVALVAVVVGVLVQLLSAGPPVSFVDVTVVFRVVGGAFAACGLVAWRRRPENHSGRLMTATGIAFLAAPLLAGLEAPLARTAGLLLRNVWLVLLVAILLTFPSGGRLRTWTDRAIVGAIAVSLLVISPLWLMFLDVEGNLLFLWPDARTAGAVDAVQQWLYLPIALVVTAVVAGRWWTASRPGRRALLPNVAGSAYLLFFTVVLTAGLVGVAVPYAVFWALAFAVAVVPVAFLTGLLRSRLARGGLVELFRGMRAMPPDELRAALARALGDPAMVIAYPATGGPGFVDAAGRQLTLPDPGAGRSVAMVLRDGEVLAALIYDRTLDDDPELVEAVGGAAAVALENQQLHVEAETRIDELRASRERIITAGDAERRRIERNLHDGAQQRLVTLALQLALIGRRIRADPAERRATRGCGGRRARPVARRAARARPRDPPGRPRPGPRHRARRARPALGRAHHRALRTGASAAGGRRVRGLPRGVRGADQPHPVRPRHGGDRARGPYRDRHPHRDHRRRDRRCRRRPRHRAARPRRPRRGARRQPAGVQPCRPRDGRHRGVAVSGNVNPLAISQIGRISSKMPPGTSATRPDPRRHVQHAEQIQRTAGQQHRVADEAEDRDRRGISRDLYSSTDMHIPAAVVTR